MKRTLSELKGYEGNPKDHDLDDLTDSFETFGYVSPIVVNTENDRLLAGHGRLEALRKLQDEGASPPPGVEARDGDWLVEVQEVALDPELHESYLIRDNKSTENGGWDRKALARMLLRHKELGLLALSGFGEADLTRIARDTKDLWPKERRWNPGSELDQLAQELDVVNGAVFSIGRHRVVCGDCCDPRYWALARGKEQEGLVLTDPPYCMNADQIAAHGSEKVVLKNDAASVNYDSLVSPVYSLTIANVVYMFLNWQRWGQLLSIVNSEGFRCKTMAVWDKGSQGLWNDWGCQHDLIMVAYRNSYKQRANVMRTNLFNYKPGRNKIHPTTKPVELLLEMLPIDVPNVPVMDPFLGSGSTLIACEHANRSCFGIEIDPKFVAATIERAEQELGLKAERVE